MGSWQDNLIDSDAGIAKLLKDTHRIAVLGIKTEGQAGQPAYYVPEAVQQLGYEIIPVPVYYPETTQILGVPVVRRLADVDPPADMINVFRRSQDLPPHLPELLAAKPKSVWLQSGIRHDELAETLARAGIKVVQDRCLMVEARLHGR